MARHTDADDLLDDLESDFLDDEDEEEQQSIIDERPKQQAAPIEEAPAEEEADDWLETTDVPGQLAVDVFQTKESILVRAPVPGVTKADIDLSIVDNTLTVRGSRTAETEVRREDYFVQECYWGEFSRSVILPVQVKEEDAEAVLKDGMLTITIPKADQDKVKKISIK
ncbi:MAG: Hsp20/alpha crystallin family protein [Candidatus Saccharimonadales bacterium]